jgi:hypothetical protein
VGEAGGGEASGVGEAGGGEASSARWVGDVTGDVSGGVTPGATVPSRAKSAGGAPHASMTSIEENAAVASTRRV